MRVTAVEVGLWVCGYETLVIISQLFSAPRPLWRCWFCVVFTFLSEESLRCCSCCSNRELDLFLFLLRLLWVRLVLLLSSVTQNLMYLSPVTSCSVLRRLLAAASHFNEQIFPIDAAHRWSYVRRAHWSAALPNWAWHLCISSPRVLKRGKRRHFCAVKRARCVWIGALVLYKQTSCTGRRNQRFWMKMQKLQWLCSRYIFVLVLDEL